jgi:hypothetical protein
MIISHVKIIAFQLSLFCKNYRFSKTVINRKIHGCLEIPDLFLVLNIISHSFAALTCEISCSTLEINLVFPRTHVLFSIYCIRGFRALIKLIISHARLFMIISHVKIIAFQLSLFCKNYRFSVKIIAFQRLLYMINRKIHKN